MNNIFTKEFLGILKETISYKFSIIANLTAIFLLTTVLLSLNDYNTDNVLYVYMILIFSIFIYMFFKALKITNFYFFHKQFLEEHGEEIIEAFEKIRIEMEKENNFYEEKKDE